MYQSRCWDFERSVELCVVRNGRSKVCFCFFFSGLIVAHHLMPRRHVLVKASSKVADEDRRFDRLTDRVIAQHPEFWQISKVLKSVFVRGA